MTRHLRLAILFLTIQGCGPDGPGAVGNAVRELRADELPASPTNRYADDPRAAALGRQLFFDPRMSANGQLSCAGCHDPRTGFADARPRSAGTGGDLGGRHALPVTTAAFQTFVLWDGRADALWQQPLMALEAPIEMDFTRAEVAHFVGQSWRAEYEEIFGALPALEALPARARPGMPAWDTLTATERDALTRVAVNVGKAIEAYERKILCTDTRFDAWTRGEAELSAAEQAGLEAFEDANCTNCHGGALFSDGLFHDLGLSPAGNADRGRADGLRVLQASELNGAGRFSDDPAAGRRHLARAAAESATDGAFRTPSLRGVTQRRAFGHLGAHATPEAFIRDTYRGRGGRGGGRGDAGLDPLLDGVQGRNADAIVTFLRTLECPTPSAELLAP